jgi:hypothetical protein
MQRLTLPYTSAMTHSPLPLVAALVMSGGVFGQAAPAPAPKIDLRVLYAGSAEGPRTADFVKFLREQFTEVGTAVYPEFAPAQADGYDVVILDVEMHPKENSIGIGKQPQLPKDWSRATVLVNGPGVIVADRQLLAKLDWL